MIDAFLVKVDVLWYIQVSDALVSTTDHRV